jgi:hypothetical protein
MLSEKSQSRVFDGKRACLNVYTERTINKIRSNIQLARKSSEIRASVMLFFYGVAYFLFYYLNKNYMCTGIGIGNGCL